MSVPADELARPFAALKAAHAIDPYPSADVRRDRLARVLAIVREREDDFVAAIDRDFGHRSSHETRLAELYIVASAARHAMRELERWMRPRRVPTPLHLRPGRAFVLPQPLGVAGIVSPWNYPVQLALAPAVAALAAGNRVMLKPSEVTPATSALLAEAIAARFAAVRPDQADRSGRRSNGSVFTVTTLAQYFLHDLVHHEHDVGATGEMR